ncbi:MAG: hypothetical protein IJ157_10945 [Clostridia bacterium]|nr:hypothetical protein [Clostridia bacterium]
MKKTSLFRNVIALTVMVGLFAYLIYGLANLQLVKGEEYSDQAGATSLKTIRTTGKRGMITDADSVILAMTEDVYNVTFYRSSAQGGKANYQKFTKSILSAIDIIEKYGGEICVDFVIGRDDDGAWQYQFGEGISQASWNIRSSQWRSNHYLTSAKYDDAAAAYDELYDRYQFDAVARAEDIHLTEEMILKVMAIYNEMQMNLFNSVPVVIAKDVSYSTVSEIEGRSMMLDGFDIEVGSQRVYPRGTLASHIIGYVGPISSYDTYENELKPQGYQLSDTIGLDGMEYSMERELTENISLRSGSRLMEKDNNGKLTRELSSTEPQDGNNVKLTIIASYQQAAERAIEDNVRSTRNQQESQMAKSTWLETNRAKLTDGSRDWDKYPLLLAETGVLMVTDVSNGNVLAMAQYPTYDLNALIAGGEAAAEILTDERNVMMNYAIQQRAEPGSTYKMVTALAALVNGAITPVDTISDGGPFMRYTNNENEAPTCWIAKNLRWQHSDQTVIQGLSHSCNYFFYELAARLYGDTGSNLLYQYAVNMGLTSKTGIELKGEARSLVGNQANLYDPSVSLTEQRTWTPTLVSAKIKQHLQNIGASNGISYNEERLDKCVKRMMDMAVSTDQSHWVTQLQIILMDELNMPREQAMRAAVVSDIYIYLNDIKWGGSLEVQTAIGQGITMVTPAAMSRYIAALGNGGKVWNLHIIDSVVSPEGEVISKTAPSLFNQLEGVEGYLPYIREGMKGVVDDSGTAQKHFKGWAYNDEIWAKTGTSQITRGNIKLDLENNSWFCALTPFSTDAEIAVIAFIPNGYSGGESSVAVKEFISWWMNEKEKNTGDVTVVGGNELMP